MSRLRRPSRLGGPSRLSWLSRRHVRPTALVVALALIAGLTVLLWPRSDTVQVTAYFPRTVGVYPGSDVRVLGVRIGEVKKVDPQGGRVRVVLAYDAEHKVPAGAKAAIVNSSVVSDRYLQLLPAYRGGPAMPDGAVIPQSRTASPVELDRIFDSLHTTSESLGPRGANKDGSLSRMLGVSADNLDGQGKKLHTTVKDLSKAVTTLSDGRRDLFGTVRKLQVFTAALAADDDNVRRFNDSLAKVAKQLAGERKDLAAAAKHLSVALTDVSGFVHDNKDTLTADVKGLSKTTRVLVKQRAALEELLDVAPTGLGNLHNAYNPASGTLDTRNNAELPQDPASLMCAVLRTSDEHADCGKLRKAFKSLPEPSSGGAPSMDKTLGGILGAQA